MSAAQQTNDGFRLVRPTASMLAVKAQMAADEAERQRIADELPVIHVGATVFTKDKKADMITAQQSGVVVDMDADGTHVYVVAEGDLTVTARRVGGRHDHATRAGRLVRLAVADLDLGLTVQRSHDRVHRAVRRGLLGAAAGGHGVMSKDEAELARAAMSLLDESGTVKG